MIRTDGSPFGSLHAVPLTFVMVIGPTPDIVAAWRKVVPPSWLERQNATFVGPLCAALLAGRFPPAATA